MGIIDTFPAMEKGGSTMRCGRMVVPDQDWRAMTPQSSDHYYLRSRSSDGILWGEPEMRSAWAVLPQQVGYLQPEMGRELPGGV